MLAVLLIASAGTYLLTRSKAADPQTVDQVVSSFNTRRDYYLNAILQKNTTTGWLDLPAAKGLLLLVQAERTGNTSRVAEANDLLYNATDLIASSDSGIALHHKVYHAGAFTYMRAYLMFQDRPDLLFQSTKDKIKFGKKKDGNINVNASLQNYKNLLFNKYTADNINFDIASYNPWDPTGVGGYNGTENHKLQTIVTGMLLAEVYAGESFRGYPVKDGTVARDDFWHYYRDAFLRYSSQWDDNRANHFARDVMESEKDSGMYAHVFLGDYWMLRDLHSDPIIKEHAEILIDRILADGAEDHLKGMYTGFSHRQYSLNPDAWQPIGYLLFDSLGAAFPANDAGLYNWGAWALIGIITSDYNPTNPDFPRAVIDIARNKGDGYMTTSGKHPRANWIEKDLSLGFLLDGTQDTEDHSGGFFVNPQGSTGDALNIAVFYGTKPFVKGKPWVSQRGVLSKRVAITRSQNVKDSQLPRLWVQNGFDASDLSSSPWLFYQERSSEGRTVYVAVRPVSGTFSRLADQDSGAVYGLNSGEALLVWEVGTSDEFASLAAFKSDVLNNTLSVTSSAIEYTSSKLGTKLTYNRSDHKSHKINNVAFDWNQFNQGFNNPWMKNPHNSYTASFNMNGRTATYDWDPQNTGNFDVMPLKTVNNNGGTTPPTPTPPPTPSPQPDLVVTNVTTSPANVLANQPATFAATIKNQGTAATPAGTVHGVSFSVPGYPSTWSDSHVASLAAGASVTVTANGGSNGANWTPTAAGSFSVTANVDDINRITNEADEANNTLAKTITVTTPTTPPPPTFRPEDINEDSIVNLQDFSILAANFNKSSNLTNPRADINADGIVNLQDFSLLASKFGT